MDPHAWGQGAGKALVQTEGLVDVDDSSIADAPRTLLLVDRRKAALLGVPQQAIVTTLRAGLAGEQAAYLHDQSKYPAAATLQLPPTLHGDLQALLQLGVRTASGALVPLRELVTRHVLEESEAAGRYRFVHDKLREMAHAGIPDERRRQMHRDALVPVRPVGGPPVRSLFGHRDPLAGGS